MPVPPPVMMAAWPWIFKSMEISLEVVRRKAAVGGALSVLHAAYLII
jgi:hypothetical protein